MKKEVRPVAERPASCLFFVFRFFVLFCFLFFFRADGAEVFHDIQGESFNLGPRCYS